MEVLLDTHALIWWLTSHPALTKTVRTVIANPQNSILVSAASAWEIATKVRLGKLPIAEDVVNDFGGYMQRERFETFPISAKHAVRAGLLPGIHRDPFDRMLIAQAQEQNIPIASNETLFDSYGVRRIW